MNLLFPVNILTLTGHLTPISSQICKENNLYFSGLKHHFNAFILIVKGDIK